MTYTRRKFGLELREQPLQGKNYDKISKWAFKIYIDEGLELANNLDYIVLKLIAMEEGSEFILSKEELLNLANELIDE